MEPAPSIESADAEGRLGRTKCSLMAKAASRSNPDVVLRKEALPGVSVPDPQEAIKDVVLVQRLRDRDEGAIAQLYDRYSGMVYSVALRVLGDTGAAEDILQEVFLQLWRNPDGFDSSRGSLGPWLAVIARNRAIDSVRKRRPATEVENVVLSIDCDLEGETGRKLAVEKARAALAKIPSEQRKALEMAFFQGLTHSEIASKTGEPLGTIKTRIRAALLALRKAMSENKNI